MPYDGSEIDCGTARFSSRRRQAVDTGSGLVVITWCGHPSIDEMAENARPNSVRRPTCSSEGFHLSGRADAEIRSIIDRVKGLGVRKVAPSHCTGDRAVGLFREAWGDDFVEGGLGAVIDVSR
ncbi:MAG: hypothetical protein WD423_12535 [Rhodothermales bacterium]